jgi:hypothetical protein
MDHAVAVERVVALQRGVHGVLGVAQVDAVEVGGDLADHLQVVGAPFRGLRPPRPGPVRMIVILRQGRQDPSDDLDVQAFSLAQPAPTTKLTVVVVLPPMLSVPNRRAPFTW